MLQAEGAGLSTRSQETHAYRIYGDNPLSARLPDEQTRLLKDNRTNSGLQKNFRSNNKAASSNCFTGTRVMRSLAFPSIGTASNPCSLTSST